jgi:hypothetical protein
VSEQEFESYLRLMSRFLHLSDAQREAIGRELRGHMEERFDHLVARGYTHQDAVSTILNEFGDAAALANDFGQIGRRKKWIVRSAAGTVAVAAAVLIVCLLLPANRLPSRAFTEAGQTAVASAPSPEGTYRAMPGSAQARTAVPVWPSQVNETDRRVREKLQKSVTLDFAEGTSLEEVLSFLRDQGDVSVDVNWNALAKTAVDRTTDTNGIKLKNVKLETAFSTLLENVGGAEHELDYAIIDGFIRISTREDLDRRVYVRVYDCRELIGVPRPDTARVVPPTPPQPATLPECPGGAGYGGMGGGGGGGYGGGTPGTPLEPAEMARQYERQRVADLEEVIKSTISPGTWAPQGSLASTICYDGLLVISAPARTHQDLLSLLTTMHQAIVARARSGGSSPAGVGSAESPALSDLQADEIILEMPRARTTAQPDQEMSSKSSSNSHTSTSSRR